VPHGVALGVAVQRVAPPSASGPGFWGGAGPWYACYRFIQAGVPPMLRACSCDVLEPQGGEYAQHIGRSLAWCRCDCRVRDCGRGSLRNICRSRHRDFRRSCDASVGNRSRLGNATAARTNRSI